MSLIRQTRNKYSSSWNNLLNNFLSRLMFQYSFVLKSITCIIYLIEKETSSEKIEKLYELSLILKSHACSIVTYNVIEQFSVTIDCLRFLIRGFLLYTYSMVLNQYTFRQKYIEHDFKNFCSILCLNLTNLQFCFIQFR